MNKFEENIYKEIKNELVQSVIDKRVDNYFTNKNELTHYYNVGKMIVDAQLSWSHYIELLSIKDINEINYYINISVYQNISRNKLREKIKSKEYQRLDDKAKRKLINKEELNIYDSIKNPIYINTYGNDKENIEKKALKSFILRDMENFLEQLNKKMINYQLCF